MGLAATRRKNELRDLLDEHLSGGVVQLLRFEGTPPYGVFGYDVLLATPYLVCSALPKIAPGPEALLRALSQGLEPNSLRVERLLPVRVLLPPTHPDRANPPGLFLLEHRVYHPSVLGPAICWAERFHPCMFLADVLRQVAALLRFELEADLHSALNTQAATWFASGHEGVDAPLALDGV